MSKLYTLLYGKSKKRMHPIMIDTLHKCENYKESRENNVRGFHQIVEAEEDATTWRQKSATIGGNKCEHPRVGKNGKTKLNGYIDSRGFNPHT